MESEVKKLGVYTAQESVNGRTLYRYKISDETVNFNGWKIITEGIDTSSFMKAGPVLLVQHDETGVPIGKIENIFAEGTILYADVWYHEENELSKLYKKLVDLDIVRSVSISVTVLEEGPTIPVTEANRAKLPVWIDTIRVFARSRLREISQVNIPANPGAVLRKTMRAALDKQKLTKDELKICDNFFQSYYELTDLPTNEGGQDMDLAVENANLKNDLKNLTAERDTAKGDLAKASAEQKKMTDANELLKKENAELKKNFDANEAKLNAANEELAKAKGKELELVIDNFIAGNKEKILPKELENGLLKSKLLQLKMNESLKVGDKTLFEIECAEIEARQPGLGLTGEMVGENSTRKIDNSQIDFSTKTYEEIFASSELSDKFTRHCMKQATEKKITFEQAFADEKAKLKAS